MAIFVPTLQLMAGFYQLRFEVRKIDQINQLIIKQIIKRIKNNLLLYLFKNGRSVLAETPSVGFKDI